MNEVATQEDAIREAFDHRVRISRVSNHDFLHLGPETLHGMIWQSLVEASGVPLVLIIEAS